MNTSLPEYDISIILPVYNAGPWLADCLRSIICQVKEKFTVELSIFNDGSTDDSLRIINEWKPVIEAQDIRVVIGGHTGVPKGGFY